MTLYIVLLISQKPTLLYILVRDPTEFTMDENGLYRKGDSEPIQKWTKEFYNKHVMKEGDVKPDRHSFYKKQIE